ncbi:MAG: GatB/YqeY domain-containing protein [Thiomicrospira sp.]|uniref:GatB/YqeY domain-containing protein n=1 Tax=Thiomicrospira sp. TaxID=935 RepID=UPI001A03A852|nr:GatB/YqeY domain-containing protein [Thiomicrospira sp.]MBE0493120.1 GatB/YqeY domain-containing protein [Thiomicrospira sp.]
MSDYKTGLTEEMKRCMKAGEKARLMVVRAMLAAIKQQEIDQQITLDDTQVLAVLDKALKQRRDSFTQYTEAAREDLAEQEAYEISVIQDFMPQPLTETEIAQMVADAVTEVEAKTMQDMGKVMALLKPKMQGKADMAVVSQKIKASLA